MDASTTRAPRLPAGGEELIYDSNIEALFLRGFAREVDDALRAKLLAIGVDLRKILPAYPLATWMKCVDLAAKHFFPELAAAEAFRKLGERTVYGMGETVVGKAMMVAARMVGPRRMMQRIATQLKASNNFVDGEVKELSPTEFEVEMFWYSMRPEFMVGALDASLRVTGAESPKVEVAVHDPVNRYVKFRASWGEDRF